MDEYILQFHDDRNLYKDVLIKVRNLGSKSYDSIFIYYNKNANEVIENTFEFEDDGRWVLKSMIRLDEINTLYFE